MIPNEGDVYQLAWLGDNGKQEDRRDLFMTLNCPRIWIWRKPNEEYLLPQNMDKMLVFNLL